jgi:cysteine desulfuration protein SufE
MFEPCLEKQNQIKKIFVDCPSKESRYQKIIELGTKLPSLNPAAKIDANLVPGCQSIMYLETIFRDGKIYFNADSEALISKGLAALLIFVYSGQPPEALLRCPPTFLSEIGLQNSLSPARSNGLASLYLKMAQASKNC